ncbi:membrane protein insertase YidC [Mycoplasmopsis alligatoris]|uniref:Membrane protein insertase, YidC/Oxa1 family n=1 Tax=Mycoplasmopsis alligatoris A21JP2 TaxID=747682 RepID=D4XWK7_9BACT|nr:membrane protein insertase YidC [Mycoplasmopsis alligatoris]EFF41237.1 membrane protein insertase, YidC/Oxa1 family [Mycoplasmopsis alligatoris A21JP2]
MNQKRSNKFDYFTNDKDPVEKKKNTLKRIWYWLKITLYVLVFGLTMTGCVQSFAIKTAGETGAGLELYVRESDIAPRVKGLEVTDSLSVKKSSAKDAEVIKLPTVTNISDENILVSNKDVLEKLRKQTADDQGQYGAYNSLNSAIKLEVNKQGLTNSDIHLVNDRYLFKVDNAKLYKPVTTFKDIYTFAIAEDANKKVLPSPLKTPNENSGTISWASGLAKIDMTFDKLTDENKANALFSRDVIQLVYDNTFANKKWTDIFEGKDPSTFIKENIIDKLKAKQEVNLSFLQKEAILTYHQTLAAQLNEFGYKPSALVSEGAENRYDTITTFEWQVGSKLAYSSVEQKPITSWGESWGLGPFYGLIVYPISYVSQHLRQAFPAMAGWETIFVIIIVVIVIKTFSLIVTFKSIVGQSIQEDLRGKKAQIEAKYKDFANNKMMKARKQQELQKLYKKHNINPLDQFLSIIISMPVFFAMWRVIQCMPEIKSTVWLGLNFSSTSYQSLFAGQWQYLGIIIVALGVQLASQLLPRLLNKKRLKERISIAENDALKKSEKTQKIIMLVFLVITVIFTAGVQVYWIITGLWTVGQTIGIYYLKKSKWWRTKYSQKFKA